MFKLFRENVRIALGSIRAQLLRTILTVLIIAIGITNYIYKFSMAILLTPLIYIGHSMIDRYLGKDNAEKISEDASHTSKGFF